MNNIITQKIKEVLKSKLFSVISQKNYELLNVVIESITSKYASTRYLTLISNLQNSIRNIVKSTIVSLFETLATENKDSKDRLLMDVPVMDRHILQLHELPHLLSPNQYHNNLNQTYLKY